MMMRFMVWCVLCVAVGSALADGPGFSGLSYKDALIQADKEHKLVFVDVFATWCGPCKLLDRTTFIDPKVTAWMKDQTVAIKVDGEAQSDLAQKYKINAFPTMLLLKPDGSEMGRVVGYLEAGPFLTEFQGLVAGKDPLTVAQESHKLDPMNYELRFKAATLQADRDPAQGLEAYKRILDDLRSGAMKGEPVYTYLRISDLPGPEAASFLKAATAEIKGHILAGDYSKEQVKTYAILTRDEQGALLLYDTLVASNVSPDQLKEFHPYLLGQLRLAKRFAELEALSPVSERLKALREEIQIMLAKPDGEIAAEEENYRFNYIYQEFVGQKRYAEADALAVELLGKKPDAEKYNALAWCAYEAGSTREIELGYAKKAYELSKGQNPYVLDTYAKMLAVRGQKKKAQKLIREALGKSTAEGQERKVLEECLHFLDQVESKGR